MAEGTNDTHVSTLLTTGEDHGGHRSLFPPWL